MLNLKRIQIAVFVVFAAMTVFLFVPQDGANEARQALADKGAAAYDSGDYQAAAKAFEDAARQAPADGHLYFNLGLTHLKAGKIGEAMGALLTARRLLPRDPDVDAALRYGTGKLKDKLSPNMAPGALESVLGWLRQFTARELAFGSALLALIVAFVASLTLTVPKWRPAHLGSLALLILPVLGVGATFWRYDQDELWGAVRPASAKVFAGPTTKQSVLFELQEGAPFVVTQGARDGFLSIALSDGKKGWISGTDVSVYGLD